MKKIKLISITIIAIFMVFMVTGCGHNIAQQTKGIGVDISWNGSNYIPNVRLGYWDDTTAVVRGNAAVSASTASGGGVMVGEGGTSQTVQIATGTQVNEGYIKDILVDENIDTQAKIEFIRMLDKLSMPKNNSANNKTTSAQSKIITSPVSKEEYEKEMDEGSQEQGEQEEQQSKFWVEELTVEKNKKLTIPADIITKTGLNADSNTVKILSTENSSAFCVVSDSAIFDENTFELFKEIQLSEDGSLQISIGKLLDVKAGDIVGVDCYKKQLIIYKIDKEEADNAPRALTAAEQK